MARRNRATDVFRYIDMSGGDSACWPFTGVLNNEGRPYFQLDGRKVLVYRLVYELVTGRVLDKSVMLRHKCDTPACCNPTHVEEGNNQQNMNDMKERERHGLPHHTVRAIRRLLAEEIPHAVIARRFGISRTAVTEINTKRYYSHVKDIEDE